MVAADTTSARQGAALVNIDFNTLSPPLWLSCFFQRAAGAISFHGNRVFMPRSGPTQPAPRIDEAGWEAGASKRRRTGEPDPRCCVDGPIQGLVGLAGAFATVGIAVWVLSGTFTMTLVVPRASNSMWTW